MEINKHEKIIILKHLVCVLEHGLKNCSLGIDRPIVTNRILDNIQESLDDIKKDLTQSNDT